METKPSYEELAEAIALCVYYEVGTMYVDGRYVSPANGPAGEYVYVDNMCSSAFQIATGVLNRIGILDPLDDMAMRNEFTCKPDEFRSIAFRNKEKGCDYDTLVLALICMLDYHPNNKPAYAMTERLGVCEPDTDPPYDKGENWPGTSTIRWTKAKDRYDALYNDWTTLLES